MKLVRVCVSVQKAESLINLSLEPAVIHMDIDWVLVTLNSHSNERMM